MENRKEDASGAMNLLRGDWSEKIRGGGGQCRSRQRGKPAGAMKRRLGPGTKSRRKRFGED